ncbi:MAG: enoyl-CoA hydratase/isomerase family protein, partial [Rhodospirillales bacterium]|nr:enoyl-CoA hydratase/isomerase family protein [Rhodospirillales bacterium]
MDLVLFEKSGAIGDIRFNNPSALNAINREMAGQFKDHLIDCAEDPAIRCVTVRGTGRAFMAGGDLKHFYENLKDIEDVAGGLIEVYHECILLMTGMDKPIVTGVQGAIAG